MLIFCCTDCDEQIDCLDNEGLEQVFARLEEHVVKCPLATFTFEGTTKAAKRTTDIIRSIIQHERHAGKLRLH